MSGGVMRWERDASVGDWLRERTEPWPTGAPGLHHLVPRGFESYARVLHPPQVEWLPGGRLPSAREWERLSAAEATDLVGRIRVAETTWAEAAQSFGTVLHPLVQWNRLVRSGSPHADEAVAPDGRLFRAPATGDLAPAMLAGVVRHAMRATSTPHRGHAALWEGLGGIWAGDSTWTLLDGHQYSRRRDPRPSLRRAMRRLGRRLWSPLSGLSPRLERGPRLELPERSHVLLTGEIGVFADPSWMLAVPWRDRTPARLGGLGAPVSPSLLWPEDRAWVVCTEVDFDSTLVGGSRKLTQALIDDPALEAFPITLDADLTWQGDSLNS